MSISLSFFANSADDLGPSHMNVTPRRVERREHRELLETAASRTASVGRTFGSSPLRGRVLSDASECIRHLHMVQTQIVMTITAQTYWNTSKKETRTSVSYEISYCESVLTFDYGKEVKVAIACARRALYDENHPSHGAVIRLVGGIIDDPPLDQINYICELFHLDEISPSASLNKSFRLL